MTDAAAPKFELKAFEDVSDEELNETLDKEGGGIGFLTDPGLYDLTIIEAINEGPAGDETWYKFQVVFQTSDEKTIRKWIMVPTVRIQYQNPANPQSKAPHFVYKQLQGFLAALGVNKLEIMQMKAGMEKYFGNTKNLVGQTVTANILYENCWAKFIQKDEYQLIAKDKPVVDENEEPMVFPDRDSVEAYCAETRREFSPFLEIKSFIPVEPKAEKKKSAGGKGW